MDTRRPLSEMREEQTVTDRLRALIIPGNPEEQQRRPLHLLDEVRSLYANHGGGEPTWFAALSRQVIRGGPLGKAWSEQND